MRRLGRLIVAGGLAAPTAAQAAPSLAKVGDFDAPVHVTGSPGDSHRLFVVERPGRVQLVVDGRRAPAPFLDISADTLSGDERGLLSIAFPPDYQASRRFYVYLTARSPSGQIQVREYRRSLSDPNRADPASGRTLLAIDHPRSNHNGGQLQFGPDGRLWIGTGDGGGGNDPDANGQNATSLLGKLLRLDPLAGGAPEIFAIGLRNPWRFSFDRQTGDLAVADVGQGAREEVDVAPAPGWRGAGANYGWPCFEGTRVNTDTNRAASRCDTLAGAVEPVLERRHEDPDGVCSITGGYVVRDPGLPTLLGRYLYGDVCAPRLRSALLTEAGTDARTDLAISTPTSFGEDACGRIYVASLNGPVHRIEDGAATPCSVDPPVAGTDPGTPAPAPPGAAVVDARKPSLRVGVRGRRSLVARRRLRVSVVTDELAAVRAGGTLRGVARFRATRRQLAAGRRVVLTVRLSRRSARKLRRTLRRKRVVAVLTILARDAAGNQRRVTRRIAVRRT